MATDYTISALDSRLKNYLETNGVEVLTKALFNSESANSLFSFSNSLILWSL